MSWTNYLFQINIFLLIFYSFYAAFLKNETFFVLNRIYLIGTGLLSFLIPLMESDMIRSLFVNDKVHHAVSSLNAIYIGGTAENSPGLSAISWPLIIYLAGLIIFSFRFILQFLQIWQIPAKEHQPYSFFRRIVISDNIQGRDSILKHETVHASQWHSADIILFELISLINWFNPVAYAYKKAVKYIHEFIADETASGGSGDKPAYALLLLSNAMGVSPSSLSNSFYNESLLKRRILMLYKSKSRRTALIKYGLSVPLFLAMVIFSSAFVDKSNTVIKIRNEIREINILPYKETAGTGSGQAGKHTSQSKALKPPVIVGYRKTSPAKDSAITKTTNDEAAGNTVHDNALHDFASVEVMPTFPGGPQAFYQYIGKNYVYPAEARTNNVSGRLILSFVVERDGSLENIKVLRDLGMGTGAEAVRLLQSSPKWNPGIQNGKPVRVQYTIPIMLNLGSPALSSKSASAQSIKSAVTTFRPGAFSSKEAPLVILDGEDVPYGKLEQLNPNTIQSINILKDSSAVTAYGSKGKNGVIIILTKKETK